MFGKRECKSCGERINSKYNFCPHCGNVSGKKAKREDFGMLGQDDFMNDFSNMQNSIFGGMNAGVMGKMLENAMKMLEKEMRKEMGGKNIGNEKNYELFINGKKINLNLSPTGNAKKQKNQNMAELQLPKGDLKDFSSLSKKEPKTDVRRFSDKVVYEVNMPGVKSESDISINNLENSIEIKAIAKGKAYKKVIPVSLPITNYNFSKGKLILELEINE